MGKWKYLNELLLLVKIRTKHAIYLLVHLCFVLIFSLLCWFRLAFKMIMKYIKLSEMPMTKLCLNPRVIILDMWDIWDLFCYFPSFLDSSKYLLPDEYDVHIW